MKKHLRQIVGMLRDAGFTSVTTQVNSKSIKATAQLPDGRIMRKVFPLTPSDWRAMRNQEAEIRRWIRTDKF